MRQKDLLEPEPRGVQRCINGIKVLTLENRHKTDKFPDSLFNERLNLRYGDVLCFILKGAQAACYLYFENLGPCSRPVSQICSVLQ